MPKRRKFADVGGGNGRGGAAYARLRHRGRQLPYRTGQSRQRRDARQNTQPLRSIGRDGRQTRQSRRRGIPSAQDKGGTPVHGIPLDRLARGGTSRLVGLRKRRHRLRGIRIRERLGDRHDGTKGCHRTPTSQLVDHRVVALGRDHARQPAQCAGRRDGGYLPMDHRLLRTSEGRLVHRGLRREVDRLHSGGHRPHMGREVHPCRQGDLRHPVQAERQNSILGVRRSVAAQAAAQGAARAGAEEAATR